MTKIYKTKATAWSWRAAAILALTIFVGCSSHVSSKSIYGTYIASYPFGSATLVLQRDGAFVQTVTVKDQPSATVKGSWSFDSESSKITLRGMMPVVDAFGHLKKEWRAVEDFENQPVEILWFRTEIETNESYGYIKQ